MHKLLRYYSQNRIKVWTIIFAIAFVLLIIQVLNNVAKEENKQNNKQKETADNVVSYHNESKSIISEGSVPERYQEKFGSIIDEFYTYCVNHEPQKAYELLAPDTKEQLYRTESQFEKLYYQEKFEGDKDYSFQSWTKSSNDIYIYQVKIFENMLATGKSNDEYIEDFVTIVPVEDNYKLNINSYIGRRQIGKKQKNKEITIEVVNADVYLNYEIYTVQIKNETDEAIWLDARNKSKTTYITDEKGNKIEAFMYELTEEDLRLKAKEEKTLQIKFNDVYHSNIRITSMNFTNMVNEESQEAIESLKINL